MPTLIHINANRARDLNGFAVPGALAWFYESGTTRAATVYADPECTVPHPQPMQADGAGVFPPIYGAGSNDLKVAVTTAEGVMLAGYPLEYVINADTENSGAVSVSFQPTESIPATNVQAAIERVQSNMIEPLADLGLGVTGSATVIADLDAVSTPSGAYRFDGTTAGVFPAEVTASGGGIVRIWRESAAKAMMLLIPAGGTRHHIRPLNATWGAWRWLISTADTVDNATWRSGSSSTPAAASPAAVKAGVDGRLNISGSAPAYSVRAWVKFNGSATPPTITANGNIASVTRPSPGTYVVTFATAMPSAHYAVSLTANSTAEFSARIAAQSASSFTVLVSGDFGGTQNPSIITAMAVC